MWITEGHKETFGGDGNCHYCDHGDGYFTLFVYTDKESISDLICIQTEKGV